MRLIEDDLRAALRAEAVRHRPDRDAMLDRITQTAMRNQFARHRKASPRLRISGAAVAVAAVLGGGGFAQWALAGDGTPPPVPPAPSVSVSVIPSDPPSHSASPSPSDVPGTATSTATSKSPPARRPRSAPASPSSPPAAVSVPPVNTPADTTANGPLWSDGSIDASDAQGTGVVTVRTTERLTALEVTIRVTRTPELVSRGGSQQVPGASVTSTVTEEPDAIVYRFTLSSGDTVDPGTYVFYARYTYAEGGRDAGGDVYAATAVTESGATVPVSGDFS